MIVRDRDRRVLEAWTGVQVEWPMARGYPGQFGRSVNAPWVWIGLCVLFVLPFARPPLRLLHLDLAVLLAFSVSYAFFGAADLDVSVPSAYPLLGYLLVRMVIAARRAARAAPPRLLVGPGLPAARDRVPGRVPRRAQRRRRQRDRRRLRERDRRRPAHRAAARSTARSRPTTRTATPTGRSRTRPTRRSRRCCRGAGAGTTCPPRTPRRSRSTSAAPALLWLIGRRLRDGTLGLLLAYLWMTYPFTLMVANSGANDALVALLVLAALLAASRPAARGALVALAGLTKFAPLALAPLFAAYRRGGCSRPAPPSPRSSRSRSRRSTSSCCGTARSASRPPATRRSRSGASTTSPARLQTVAQVAAVALRGRRRLPAARRPRRAGRPRRRGADRAAARGRPLVLPLPGVVRPAGVGRAAQQSGAGRRICSIESARRGCDARISTALIHGSSSEES